MKFLIIQLFCRIDFPPSALEALSIGDLASDSEVASSGELRKIQKMLEKFMRDCARERSKDIYVFADGHECQDFHSNLSKASYALITGIKLYPKQGQGHNFLKLFTAFQA